MIGGNGFGFGNLPSQGLNYNNTNINNIIAHKEEISKEEEGDIIKKKTKME